jgi:pimeloyl-ACP methyl ester carboxylesterase
MFGLERRRRISAWRHAPYAVLLLLCLLGCFQPALAEHPAFFPVWIDESGELTPEAVEALVADFAAQNPDPEHIVVWIHGFANTRETSAAQYDVLTDRVYAAFDKYNHKVGVVGLQWDSQAGGFIFTLPGQYESKTLLARKVGRHGARAFLLALQKRFPEAHLNMMGHSMGCEVIMAALRPEVQFSREKEVNGVDAFEPATPLLVHTAALLGADLDYDLGQKSRLPVKAKHIKLFWLTENSQFRPQEHDKVLGFRSLLAGKAMGATFPLMTEEQYDALIGNRVVVFDRRDIPRNHKFTSYYNEDRVDRLVRGLLLKAGASVEPPPELVGIDEVMDAPQTLEALRPFLDRELLAPRVYAIWRLEHLFEGNSSNFANGELQSIATTLYHRPKKVRTSRSKSKSTIVRDNVWPTKKDLARAGAPPWASPLGYNRRMHFRGEVIRLEDGVMGILTTFGDVRTFGFDGSTRFTPSRETLRIGSKVEVQGFWKELEEVHVIPEYVWITKKGPQPEKATTGPEVL